MNEHKAVIDMLRDRVSGMRFKIEESSESIRIARAKLSIAEQDRESLIKQIESFEKTIAALEALEALG